jgi:hypothetical protein
MKNMKLAMAGMLMFGFGLGTSVMASTPSITPEMAQCIAACEAAGSSHAYCWACCVQKRCELN